MRKPPRARGKLNPDKTKQRALNQLKQMDYSVTLTQCRPLWLGECSCQRPLMRLSDPIRGSGRGGSAGQGGAVAAEGEHREGDQGFG
jgi:hypothetical protein